MEIGEKRKNDREKKVKMFSYIIECIISNKILFIIIIKIL